MNFIVTANSRCAVGASWTYDCLDHALDTAKIFLQDIDIVTSVTITKGGDRERRASSLQAHDQAGHR